MEAAQRRPPFIIPNGYGDGHANYNAGTLGTGSWQVVVLTFDGSTVTVYINGVVKGSGTISTNTVLAGTNYLGYEPFDPFNNVGYIYDYVAAWNRALTTGEIASLT